VRAAFEDGEGEFSSGVPDGPAQCRGPMAALRIQIQGEGAGWILILMSLPTVYRLLETLMSIPPEPRRLTTAECSAVQEVGNIVASSFLSELGDRLDRRWLPSPPELHLDNTSQLVPEALTSPPLRGGANVVVHALLHDRERAFEGHVFVMWDTGMLEPMTKAPGEQGIVS
jgi:chemotaxis protein CheC